MSNRLQDRICLVTGAAQGIGQAIAMAFLREGASVIATDMNGEHLQAAYKGTAVRTAAMDVTDEAAVAAVAKAHARVDVLVNCAGWVANGTVLESGNADMERSFRINVIGMANTIRAFLPGMRERKAGSIVNIASAVSTVAAVPNRFAYGTSKAAVIGLTMSVARDYIGDGVRCNSISPGTVDSPSLEERLRATGDEVAARAAFIARQPMGRIGRPDEIAAVAVLLASDEAGFMTGSNIIIDGGLSL